MKTIPKGIWIIALLWICLNLVCYTIWGIGATLICTYTCAAIVWFGRRRLQNLLNI